MYIISSIFRLLTVTHGQGSMCIKNNALLINKHHPNDQDSMMREECQKGMKLPERRTCFLFYEGDFESSTKYLPYEANARLRRVLEKATQHKEMGPEYLHQGTPSVFM